MAKIAVTGANGFLGKVLLPVLEDAGHEVISITRHNGYDITDWQQVKDLNGFEVLIHLAAKSFVPDAYANPRAFYNTNVNGTLNMLELARMNNARFIFISSYVYGHPDYMPIDEKHPLKTVNPYAESKLIAENLCKAYHRDFGLDVMIFRPFNIYGPMQPAHFLIRKMVQQVLDGKTVELFDVRPKRDYIHVQDVATALLAGVQHKGEGLEVFNLGSGRSYAIPEILEMLETIIGKKIEVIYLNQIRPNEIMDTVCDNNSARTVLNWEPTITFAAGLKEMIQQDK